MHTESLVYSSSDEVGRPEGVHHARTTANTNTNTTNDRCHIDNEIKMSKGYHRKMYEYHQAEGRGRLSELYLKYDEIEIEMAQREAELRK